MVGYVSLLCLLALRCSQEIDWLPYGSDDLPFLVMNSRRGRRLIFHSFALARGPRRVPAILFMFHVTSFDGFERHSSQESKAENLSGLSSTVLGFGWCCQSGYRLSLLLDDLELFSETNGRWTIDVGTSQRVLRSESELLRVELPELQMTVPTDSQGLVGSDWKIINKTSV